MHRIGLYLMGEKGLNVLNAAVSFNNEKMKFVFVVAAKDNSVEKDYYEEIKSITIKNNIPFFDKNNFDNSLDFDYIFAISWRWILNNSTNKLIVFHDSLLPKYRGFNPLVTALINGDNTVGVTAIIANQDFDKGDIIMQKSMEINYPIKIQKAIQQISKLYSELFIDILYGIENNNLTFKNQSENDASYSLWRNEDDYLIDWNLDSKTIKRMIDASGFPYSGAITHYENIKIIIEDVDLVDDLNISNRQAGKLLSIIENKPIVVCGSGLIKINKSFDFKTKEEIKYNKLRIKLK